MKNPPISLFLSTSPQVVDPYHNFFKALYSHRRGASTWEGSPQARAATVDGDGVEQWNWLVEAWHACRKCSKWELKAGVTMAERWWRVQRRCRVRSRVVCRSMGVQEHACRKKLELALLSKRAILVRLAARERECGLGVLGHGLFAGESHAACKGA